MIKRKAVKVVFELTFFICILLLISTGGIVHALPMVSATLNANPSTYSGTCPATIKFEGEITVKGVTKEPLNLKYQFIRSDGATGPVSTLTFQQDGTKKVSTTWTLGGGKVSEYSGWEAIRILLRPPVESNKANFKIECKAGQQPGIQKTEIKPLENIKLDDVKIIKEPVRKITSAVKAVIPDIKNIKADLTCTIKAYYNQQKTGPIQDNVWHMSSFFYNPPLPPSPWRIYYDIEVKNIGTAKAENFSVKVHFQNPVQPPQDFLETASLDPGETAVFPYNWGPFVPTSLLLNKSVLIGAMVDSTLKIEELDENNNSSSFIVKFVFP